MNDVALGLWGLLFLLGIIWGSSFYAVSLSLQNFKPMQIAACRITIGAIVLTLLYLSFGDSSLGFSIFKKKTWFYSFGMGIFTNALPFFLLSWAQTEVSSSFAGVAMSIVPFSTLILAHYFTLDKILFSQKIIGLTIGFMGMILLFDLNEIYNQWIVFEEFRFKLACLGAAISYSIGAIITRRSPTQSKLAFSVSGLLAGAIVILPVALFYEGIPRAFTLQSFFAVVYLGVFPTGLATIILVYLIKSVGPTFLSLVNYLVPVWAILFGVYLNAELLEFKFFVATACILFGMILSQRVK